MMFLMKGGTVGPGMCNEKRYGSSRYLFLRVRVTFTIKEATLLSNTTIAAIWARTPARGRVLSFGFARMQKSSLAEELVLSDADLRALSFR